MGYEAVEGLWPTCIRRLPAHIGTQHWWTRLGLSDWTGDRARDRREDCEPGKLAK